MQVKWKWCDKFKKDNLKLHMARNLWEEASLPSLYYTLCLSVGTTSKCHFPSGIQNGSSKTRTFVVPKIWTLIFFQTKFFF